MQLSPWRVLKTLRETLGHLREEVARNESRIQALETQLVESSASALRQAADERERRLREATDSIVEFVTLRVDEVQVGLNQLLIDRTSEVYADLIKKIDDRILSTENAILSHISSLERSIAATQNDLRGTQSDLARQMSELRRALSALQRVSFHSSTSPDSELATSARTSPIDDVTYSMIEDRFRGSTDEIYERQRQYLPYVQERVTHEFPLLDVGCGRGEWLRLLRDHGLHATGLDMNVAFVEECHEADLSVALGVIPEHFASIKDDSLGAITMFQVAEHLDFATLQTSIHESHRVLKPGGVLIIEFPNIQTHAVGASTFWIDPTHARPLHPQVVEFLVQTAGFTLVPSMYSSPVIEIPELSGLDASTKSLLLRITEMVGGSGDVAVIGFA